MHRPRGGKRDGAGRPTLPGEDRRVALPARVHPSTLNALKSIAESDGTSVGTVIEEMASTYLLLREQAAATSDDPRPRPEEFKNQKKLTAARQQHVVGVLSKLFNDGTFAPDELRHFLTVGNIMTGSVVNKVAADYGKKHKSNAVEVLLSLALTALHRAARERARED